MLFHDRRDAGRQLAERLVEYANRDDILILALPRGGVPVAYEVAQALHVPWDVFLVRKLGVPGQEELAMGAIASGGVRVLNHSVVNALSISDAEIEHAVEQQEHELERRERVYRDDRPFPSVSGRIVILIDDGLATGATMRAAVQALRQRQPDAIIVAVPVAALATYEDFKQIADGIVCVDTPEPFHAVGLWYEDFGQTTDEEVHELLSRDADHPVLR